MFAQVAIENTVYHFDKLFTYEVPVHLVETALPGTRVAVPFGAGNKSRVGMVMGLCQETEGETKPLLSVLDEQPVLSPEMLRLTHWMKQRYYCTLYDGIKAMIPSGMQYTLNHSYLLSPDFKDFDRERFTPLQWEVLMIFSGKKKALSFSCIEKELGITESHQEFSALLEQGIVCKVNTAASKIKDATTRMVRAVPGFTGKLTPRQKELYEALSDVGEASEKELCYFTGASGGVVKALKEKGAAEIFEYERYRRPALFTSPGEKLGFPELSPEQQGVYTQLREDMDNHKQSCGLLYGVTGSGKTAVFLRLIASVLQQGKDCIVMVPEISLTAQTIRQFYRCFGDTIAVFHSGLSLGERLDEWKRVNRGEAKIVVGTRSAVFAPLGNLGLIVIDEEHEHTYKSEASPRYDAREVARTRCQLHSAFCLLCSATPSVESYRSAQEGGYGFYQLTQRFGAASIPQVELVDMNQDGSAAGLDGIGESLTEALRENMEEGHQSIILLNRRGYHTFASCRACHGVVSCPHCSISLTYHTANRRLLCHYCGYSIPHTTVCPTCGSESVVFRGAGTQKAEEQLTQLLPEARVLRVDTDSVTAAFSLEKKLEAFSKGNYDIMVGTQMVAKGLDFENVTLVGVLSADQSLYSDDFRSSERTFDLLTQVVGRAGRGRFSGKAMIQTYIPEHPVLHLAAEQNYVGFYRQELDYRKALLYPPFVDLAVVGFVGAQEALVRRGAETFLHLLSHLAKAEYTALPLRVLNPSPAAVAKVSNKYRYKVIMKCRNTPKFQEMLSRLLIQFAKQKEFQQVTCYADANPITIL